MCALFEVGSRFQVSPILLNPLSSAARPIYAGAVRRHVPFFQDTARFMFKPSTRRAQRRHHIQRLKKRRRFRGGLDLAAEHGRLLGKALATPAACSCVLCGNPRRHFGEPTLQERRASEV